jgi:hypothetical protein
MTKPIPTFCRQAKTICKSTKSRGSEFAVVIGDRKVFLLFVSYSSDRIGKFNYQNQWVFWAIAKAFLPLKSTVRIVLP